MANAPNRPTDHGLSEILDRFDKPLQLAIGHLRKIHERIARSKKSLSDRPSTIEISKLAESLRELATGPASPSVSTLIDELKRRVSEIRATLQDAFRDEIRKAASDMQMSFRLSADGYGLGPFFLEVDAASETASLSYAKYLVQNELPLSGAVCVEKAKEWQASILGEPVDVARVGTQLEEAVRVSAARKNKSIRGEIRAELPQVFRELEFIRRSPAAASGKPKAGALSLPRFVVELSRVIQSEKNIDTRRLRLETAVIENAKDSRKSVFIPKDLSSGFGEGTYYQALVLHDDPA